ncbi:MAG: PspC domain-containing protein [Paludibacter sp.]|nr:PspC domain-containing protein [Paludibacter sp.]
MEKKLRRSNDQMIAGVCAGIAEYMGLDVTLVRVGYVILSVLSVGFPGTLLYIILWLIMPRQ